MIKIANAPCSWGALEFDLEHKSMSYREVLQEMVETGYEGTELGDWGFMPTRPSDLKEVLSRHQLILLGAFVPVALKDREAHQAGLKKAERTAKLMYEAGFPEAFIVLADDNGADPHRTRNAGRISSELMLSEDQWKIFADGAGKIASEIRKNFSMRTVFHHHCAGFVETPSEVDKLMGLTDPAQIGLCLDTGHFRFGGGKPEKALEVYYDRIWHIHFKDYNTGVGENARKNRWDYFKSVEKGVFCELGKGDVDFGKIVDLLKKQTYKGWIVVEQDVLPGMGKPMESAMANRIFISSLGL